MDKVLEKLFNAFGVSGEEDNIKEIIKEELKEAGCNVKEDKLGNLIVKLGEGNEKVMLCANMDTVGLIISYIEDKGSVRFVNIGDIKAKDFLHGFVEFKNGVVGKIGTSKSNPSIRDLFIDLQVDSGEEALKKVNQGDVAILKGKNYEFNEKIISPYIDNRIGCYVMLKLIKMIKKVFFEKKKDERTVKNSKELYFVFSIEKHMGAMGARAATRGIAPDKCFVIDVKASDDVIGGNGKIKLGAGPVISLMDKTLIIHHEIKAIIQKAAESAGINLQYNISTSATEGGYIHKELSGIKTGVISIPCRYMHSAGEMITMEDVTDTIKLINVILGYND